MHYTFLNTTDQFNTLVHYQLHNHSSVHKTLHTIHYANKQSMEIATLETILACYNPICDADSMHVVPNMNQVHPLFHYTRKTASIHDSPITTGSRIHDSPITTGS